MRIARALAVALCAVSAAAPAAARAERWWTYEETDEEYIPRIRFAPHIGLWVGEFDRTTRACKSVTDGVPVPTVVPPDDLPNRDFPDEPQFLCATANSDEIGLSAGATAIYRVIGPAHLSVGLDLAFTFPSRQELATQFIVAIPIGVGLTHDAWQVRPILNANLTPYLSLPDLRRGFAWGGEWGLAVRIPDLAELQIVGGYHASSDWQMGIVRVSGYLP